MQDESKHKKRGRRNNSRERMDVELSSDDNTIQALTSQLHKALNSYLLIHSLFRKGTDEQTVIKILCGNTNEIRQKIATHYYTISERTLHSDIKNNTSGEFKRLMSALSFPRIVQMAQECFHAVEGFGTDEKALIDILSHTDTHVRAALCSVYQQVYQRTLELDIKGDTSFNFKKALITSLQPCPETHNPHADALLIEKAVQDKSNVSKVLIEVLCGLNPRQVSAVVRSYTQLTTQQTQSTNTNSNTTNTTQSHSTTTLSLLKVIRNETTGDCRRFLAAVLTPWDEYWAKRIHDSLHGIGNEEKVLIRAFFMNDKHTFPSIIATYERLYHSTLRKEIPSKNKNFSDALETLLG